MCHEYATLHPHRDEAYCIRLVRKLVQVVRHAAELSDIIRMFRCEPFLYVATSHALVQELTADIPALLALPFSV